MKNIEVTYIIYTMIRQTTMKGIGKALRLCFCGTYEWIVFWWPTPKQNYDIKTFSRRIKRYKRKISVGLNYVKTLFCLENVIVPNNGKFNMSKCDIIFQLILYRNKIYPKTYMIKSYETIEEIKYFQILERNLMYHKIWRFEKKLQA